MTLFGIYQIRLSGMVPGRVVIDGFRLKANCDDAILDINGVVSADNTDTLTVRLNSVELVDILRPWI